MPSDLWTRLDTLGRTRKAIPDGYSLRAANAVDCRIARLRYRQQLADGTYALKPSICVAVDYRRDAADASEIGTAE